MNVIFAVGLESIFRLIAALVMFVLVLAACYFTTIWIGNYQKGRTGKGNIEVLEVHRLANNKCIEIVRIGRQYYVLAVSKDHVEKIGMVDETELEIPEQGSAPVYEDFSQILEKFKQYYKKEKK